MRSERTRSNSGRVIPPLSILDLAIVERGATVRESLDATVELARHAEALGYRRIWYAEHHNMKSIASSATSVLIAHVAAHTDTIRLGAGGIMLPNHSPLMIAEQFGTLAELHPGRIDLGLGRAPGSDQLTQRALRRDPSASDRFPHDVVELQGYLGNESRIPGVEAVPGKGTAVPLYILGSSLFGASLAAVLGLPFAFASHFAPDALEQAAHIYRERFEPSEQLDQPYLMAGINVVVSDDGADAEAQLLHAQRRRAARFVAPGRHLTDDEADEVLRSPAGKQVAHMMRWTAAGDSNAVNGALQQFADHTKADELIIVGLSPTLEQRLRSATLLAELASAVA
jgi:luciferase family oxidoreductase group 1